ncbi:MAG: asparagine synthase (glutamine-hydrolyzing) [Gammaproteobacteria bacterium RIFCSPHIGHO2_12_FULL_35_23]|nr:MAG: asparagine synthase (glutamine-hydrolyzing) [Gammaproteobacteria bacterium RIFCSPHIGHO2_12_FULL_35_23]
MCGIAGLINISQGPSKLEAMLATIAHRGPDASGFYHSPDQKIFLGHRRLSIIDLSHAADQPFIKEGWILVYNGELYNYKELSQELANLGARFQTHSDTEVILEAWRYWGAACLIKFRGMFAFALYNQETKQLFLARDQFGIKPLFIYQEGEALAFASELKALTGLLKQRRLNYTALAASLLYVWIPDSVCIYQNIIKFPKAHWAEVSATGQLKIKQYYNLSEIATTPLFKDYSVTELESVLLDSVAKHLIADVPVSTFLSGGLDSSLLTAMAKHYNEKIDSYTIAFRNQDKRFEAMPDDANYAKRLAKQLGIKLHTIEIEPNIIELLPQAVKMLDEPIGDAATINTYLICQAAKKAGVKVLLSGMGADELFAGYRKHYACVLAAQYRRYLPLSLREKLIKPMIEKMPVAGKNKGYRLLRWAQRFTKFANLPEEQGFLRSYTYYDQTELRSLLDPSLRQAILPIVAEHANIYNQGPSHDQINRMCYTDVELFMLGLNLTYTDRASMAASTEVRVPYIDKEVVKAAFNIPGHQKIHGKCGKYLLKKVAEKWLPSDIIYRPKAGFSMPLRAWIRHDLAAMVEEYLLSEKGLIGRGFINKNYLQKMIQDDRQGKADYAQQLWQLLTLETWFRERGMT